MTLSPVDSGGRVLATGLTLVVYASRCNIDPPSPIVAKTTRFLPTFEVERPNSHRPFAVLQRPALGRHLSDQNGFGITRATASGPCSRGASP